MRLVEVDLKRRAGCEHPDIKADVPYLALCDDGDYCAGKFHRTWYGWNMMARYDAGVQLDWIVRLWEIMTREVVG